MQKVVTKVTLTETTYVLTESEVKDIVRAYLNVGILSEVTFNIGGGGYIKDDAITVYERKSENV